MGAFVVLTLACLAIVYWSYKAEKNKEKDKAQEEENGKGKKLAPAVDETKEPETHPVTSSSQATTKEIVTPPPTSLATTPPQAATQTGVVPDQVWETDYFARQEIESGKKIEGVLAFVVDYVSKTVIAANRKKVIMEVLQRLIDRPANSDPAALAKVKDYLVLVSSLDEEYFNQS